MEDDFNDVISALHPGDNGGVHRGRAADPLPLEHHVAQPHGVRQAQRRAARPRAHGRQVDHQADDPATAGDGLPC